MPSAADIKYEKQKNNIAMLLAQGQIEQARKANIVLCKKFPRSVEGWLNLGTIHGMQGSMQEAESCFHRAAQIQPDSAQAYFNLGIAQASQNKNMEAIDSYQRALALDPGNAEAASNLGILFLQAGNARAAFAHQQRASELRPGSARIQYNLASVHEELLEPREALNCLARAIELEPEFTDARINAGFILERLNRHDEADRYATEVLAKEPHNARANILRARTLRRKGELDAAIHCARTAQAQAGALSSRDLADTCYEMGVILDKQGQHDEAFRAFCECGRINASMTTSSGDVFLSDVKTRRDWLQSRDRIESPLAATGSHSTGHHVFLVGFPRSGTTLLEQVLSAHSKIATTDERPVLADVVSQVLIPRSAGKPYPHYLTEASHEVLELCRKWYWIRAREHTGKDFHGLTLVDKLPFNLIHLDVIQYLFPDSRILVALRDPRDVVLSCFMQQFQLNEAMSNFNSVSSTVDLYIEVMQLWLEYKNKISLPCKELKYEKLITDFEVQGREIFAFLDLPWEPSIRDFHEQAQDRYISTPSYQGVGSPLYKTSAGRWKNYRHLIGDEIERLAPLVEALGYSAGDS